MTGIALASQAVFATGAVLLWLGWRGRRVDDHPVCRGCRYDLRGQVSAVTCPECGAALAAPRAVARGNRRRRPAMLAVGGTLAGLSGAALLMVVVAPAGTGGQVQRLKPFALLRFEATTLHSDAALDELHRRGQAGGLTAAQVQKLVGDAMAVLPDTSQPWDETWGDIWWTAAQAGAVHAADVEAYLQAMVADIDIRIRDRLREGDPIAVGMTGTLRGLGTGGEQIEIGVVAMHTGTTREPLSLGNYVVGEHGMGGWMTRDEMPWFNALPVGRHDLKVEFRCAIHQPALPHMPTLAVLRPLAIEKLPADADLLPIVKDPAEYRRIADGATLNRLFYEHDLLAINVTFPERTRGAAYEIWVTDGEREHELSAIHFVPGNRHGWQTGGSLPDGWRPERVSVELRPSVRAALHGLGTQEVLAGDLHFDDVPIAADRSAARDDERLHAREAQPQ